MTTRTVTITIALAACVSLVSACGPATETFAPATETKPPNAPSPASPPMSSAPAADPIHAALANLEEEFDARIGVSAVDLATTQTVQYRDDERFGFASALKVFAAAQILRQVPHDQRGERHTWSQADLDTAGYSPVTSNHVDTGLTLMELTEAAVRESDNTAMNVMLGRIGGPEAMTNALTALGDTTTHVVDLEPDLNRVDHSSTHNTTTPATFTANMVTLMQPEHLDPADRDTLIEWMSGNATGDSLIRAGTPEGWVVADKSGGAGALRHDIALVSKTGRKPIVLTVFTEKWDRTATYEDVLVARVANVVLDSLG